MYLGKLQNNFHASSIYERLAIEDENAAKQLREMLMYRHSMYFYIQAMEKYIRSKIFTLVNANIPYFRQKNKHHSLHDAIDFLIEVISIDENIRKQVKSQIENTVFEGIDFRQLHNDLRYPFYSYKDNSYSSIKYDYSDCMFIENRLNTLKKFLNELYKL